MAGLSNAAETSVINHIFGSTTYTKPAGKFCSLHSADPADTGANAIAVTRQAIPFTDATGNQMTNNASVSFTSMPAQSSGAMWGIGIWDSSSGGIFLGSGPFSSTSPAVTAGATFTINTGTVTVAID